MLEERRFFMKKIVIFCIVIAVLLIPLTAFAATNSSSTPANSSTPSTTDKPQPKFAKIDSSKLTDAQKKDLEDQHAKMIALQKETINKMVANGTITKEQGDEMLAKMDNMEKIRKEKGIIPMPGMGMGKGGKGRGMCEGKRGDFKGCPKGACTEQPQAPTA
jgi:pyruvate/2-oxoglutarate dehydrogenase complex dihydrolipoamide acyltransferase (E2) component